MVDVKLKHNPQGNSGKVYVMGEKRIRPVYKDNEAPSRPVKNRND